MEIKREWSMPNSKTFSIKPIKNLIKKYADDILSKNPESIELVVDPFANEFKIGDVFDNDIFNSITND